MVASLPEMGFSHLNPRIDAANVLDDVAVSGIFVDGHDEQGQPYCRSIYLDQAGRQAMPTPIEMYAAYKACGWEILKDLRQAYQDPVIAESILSAFWHDENSPQDRLDRATKLNKWLSETILPVIKYLEEKDVQPVSDKSGLPAILSVLDKVAKGNTAPIDTFDNMDEPHDYNISTAAYYNFITYVMHLGAGGTPIDPEFDQRLTTCLPLRTQKWLEKGGNSSRPEPA